jgi:orotidine-5'-phosphate decarboxylase
MKSHERIIFALDVPNREEAWRYINLLQDHVGMFKIGMELFISEPGIVREITGKNIPVMLDLKLHDIPETVRRTVLSAGELGVKFLTLHIQQEKTLIAAVEAANKVSIQLLGVTVLTSMSERDCEDLGYAQVNITRRVKSLVYFAYDYGIRGFVCSPYEIQALRTLPPDITLVVPGIRPDGSASEDQKRTGTPAQAIKDGADYLVIGRPIRDAADPVVASYLIAQEMENK